MPKSVHTIGVAAIAVVTVILQGHLLAIGPTVLMFYGSPLKHSVFVTGADAGLFGDLVRPSTVAATETAGRPFVNVALFWGSPADPAVNGVRTLAELTPDMAWQHGRFYPATATQPALLLATAFTKRPQPTPAPTENTAFVCGGALPPSAVAVLERVGIPTGPAR
jgi:hypothetical protein